MNCSVTRLGYYDDGMLLVLLLELLGEVLLELND
jgi:hypothetical protein